MLNEDETCREIVGPDVDHGNCEEIFGRGHCCTKIVFNNSLSCNVILILGEMYFVRVVEGNN